MADLPKRVWSGKKQVYSGKKPVWVKDGKLGVYNPNFEEVTSGEYYSPNRWGNLSSDAELQIYDDKDSLNGTDIGTFEDGLEGSYQFIDWDGTVLKSGTVKDGETPVAPANPTKPSTAQYTYTFTGWNPAVGPITKNTTYSAVYEATVNSYTITFIGYNAVVLQRSDYAYGETPVYTGETPTYPDDEHYTYTFVGWSPAIHPVTGEEEYHAVFHPEPKGCVITFEVDDGTYSRDGGTVSQQSIIVPEGTTVESDKVNFYGPALIFRNNGQVIATVTATPNSGKAFDYRMYDDINPDNITTNGTMTAVFTDGYTLTFVSSPSGTGTFSQQSLFVPMGCSISTDISHIDEIYIEHMGSYDVTTITAIPNQGYVCIGFEPGDPNDDWSNVYADMTIIGNFSSAINVTTLATPGGTVSTNLIKVGANASTFIDPNNPEVLYLQDWNCYEYGTVIATPNQGQNFIGWYNPTVGYITDMSQIRITEPIDIYAVFDGDCTVSFTASAGGTVSPQSLTVPAGSDFRRATYANELEFASGDTVTATPNSGYIFNGWSIEEGVVLGNMTINASFVQGAVVTFAVNPSGAGTVSEQSMTLPLGTSFSADSQNPNHLNITWGDTFYIEATANQGYTFNSWSPSSGTINGNTTITAEFDSPYTITFQAFMQDDFGTYIGDGGGTFSTNSVTVSPGAHATVSGNTMTIVDSVYGNSTVTFTVSPDTAQYEYNDEYGWTDYFDGTNTDYTYDDLLSSGGINSNGTVGFDVRRRLQYYEVHTDIDHSGSGTGSVSVSQPRDREKPYGTTWTVSDNVITFSDGSTVTATPNSGSYFSGWMRNTTCYGPGAPLPASGTITGELDVFAVFGETYTITFQPYMEDYDSGSTIGNGGGTCAPSSVSVTENARATVNGNIMTIIDPILGNTTVTFNIAQDTAQYGYEFYDFSEYYDPDYGPDGTYYDLTEARGIDKDGTVGVRVYRRTMVYEFYISSYDDYTGTVSYSESSYEGYKPYGVTWTVSNNVITLSDGTSFTATPNSGFYFDGWYDPSDDSAMPASGTITGNLDYRAKFSPYYKVYADDSNGHLQCSPSYVTVRGDATVNWTSGSNQITFSTGETLALVLDQGYTITSADYPSSYPVRVDTLYEKDPGEINISFNVDPV